MDFQQFKNKYQQTEVDHYPHKVTDNVLVSILVQAYNHEAYIKQCLDAILEQKTSFNFEILLGEDNSTDNTREICLEYAKKFPDKIRLFLHQDENKISVKGIKTGNFNAFYNFYNANGKYIAFCEGDDYWTDTSKLQKQADYLKNHSHNSFCFHRFIEKFETDQETRNLLIQPNKDLNSIEVKTLQAHPLLSTICFKKSFKELPEEMIKILNVDSFLISILGSKGAGHFDHQINPTVYKRHSGGVWTNLQRNRQIKLKILTNKYLILFYFRKMHITTALYFLKKLFYHFIHLKQLK